MNVLHILIVIESCCTTFVVDLLLSSILLDQYTFFFFFVVVVDVVFVVSVLLRLRIIFYRNIMNGYLYHHQRSLGNVDATMVMMMIDTSLKHTSDVVGRILQSINLGGNCSTKIYWIHDEKGNENGWGEEKGSRVTS